MPPTPPDRVDIQEVDVYTSILTRLRSQLGLNTSNCSLSISPDDGDVVTPTGGNYFLNVGPGGGEFPADAQEGGGDSQCTENLTVLVAIYTKIRTDSVTEDTQTLTEATRGLLAIKRKVLKALVGFDLLDAAGHSFLRKLVLASHTMRPGIRRNKNGLAWLTVAFVIGFDHDLAS